MTGHDVNYVQIFKPMPIQAVAGILQTRLTKFEQTIITGVSEPTGDGNELEPVCFTCFRYGIM